METVMVTSAYVSRHPTALRVVTALMLVGGAACIVGGGVRQQADTIAFGVTLLAGASATALQIWRANWLVKSSMSALVLVGGVLTLLL